ncbi:hypothetical protein [Clostridium frigoriphilum]|uniref:Uncharacterized protein n=1 Tax=Clostridium frigoriphilum TaxID=443253 RepID=A0ABU7UNW1_9CLOT
MLQVITKRLSQTENLAHNLATNDAETRIAYMILVIQQLDMLKSYVE